MKKNKILGSVNYTGMLKLMKIMRLTTFLLFISLSNIFARSSYSQQIKLTLDMKNVKVEEVIDAIEKNSEFFFLYNKSTIDVDRIVDLKIKEGNIKDILDNIFRETSVAYSIKGRQIYLVNKKESDPLPVTQPSITRTITGVVYDRENNPIPGATISVKGTVIGTISNSDGSFSLSVPENERVLIVSFIGFEPQEVILDRKTEYKIIMRESVIGIDEVVVVGYGSQQKATITGAISGIDNKSLIQSPVANISNALTGKIAGLLMIQESGAPGYDQSTLRIRGVGTFTGNNSPLIMVDGIEAQSFNNIDPYEIENVSILKDASATAVYGVRGANGVILVTTKRGVIGKPQISISAQTAIMKVAEERHFMNSANWAQGHTDALAYDSYVSGTYNPKYTPEDIQKYRDQTDPLFYPDVNWADLVLRPTTSQSQYNLNVSGGLEHVKYFISLGHINQEGLFNGDLYDTGFDEDVGYKRYNFRSNFDFDVTKRLKIKVNLSSQVEHFKGNPNPTAGVINYGNYLNKLYTAPPNVSPGVWDGKIVNLSTQAGQFYQNPLERFFGLPFQRAISNSINGMIRLDYSLNFITKGLSAHGTFSYQNRNRATKTIQSALVEYQVFPLQGGGYGMGPMRDPTPFSVGESTSFSRREDLEVGLDYSRHFKSHSLGGLLLYNQSKEYPGPSLSVPRGYQGLVGRATYDYKKRYMVEFNFGYNGTENFAVGKRFGFFPAYSLGWVVTDEPFFPKNKWLTYMKVRGSYGEVGNDRIGGNRFLYNPSSYVYGSAANAAQAYAFGLAGVNLTRYEGASEGTLGNPSVTWERAKKYDIGVDFYFTDKLKVTIDYFTEKRDNILATSGRVPRITGIGFPAFNFGKMENQGVDGEISYNDKVGSVNYWARFVFTLSDNKVIFRDEPTQNQPYLQSTGQRDGQYFGLLESGYYNSWEEVIDAYRPVSSYSSNKIQPGDFKYKDINGDGIINQDDRIPLGYSPFPNGSYGISFGGDYKGFDISVLFQAALRYSHNTTRTFMKGWGDGNGSTLQHVYDDSWTYEKYMAGESINMPRMGIELASVHNYQTNSRWIEDSSYLRLKNLELGYSLPESLVKRFGIQSVRLYLNGFNLLTFSKLHQGEDPETPTWSDSNNEPYPLMKTYNAGINIRF